MRAAEAVELAASFELFVELGEVFGEEPGEVEVVDPATSPGLGDGLGVDGGLGEFGLRESAVRMVVRAAAAAPDRAAPRREAVLAGERVEVGDKETSLDVVQAEGAVVVGHFDGARELKEALIRRRVIKVVEGGALHRHARCGVLLHHVDGGVCRPAHDGALIVEAEVAPGTQVGAVVGEEVGVPFVVLVRARATGLARHGDVQADHVVRVAEVSVVHVDNVPSEVGAAAHVVVDRQRDDVEFLAVAVDVVGEDAGAGAGFNNDLLLLWVFKREERRTRELLRRRGRGVRQA
mmetsp:Transcript_23834/g.73356  ORF Transcript_23834/g.73356 Transcript_23834/m.73356 type:complete len:292 (-) Transcript_23834:629-1504(-)